MRRFRFAICFCLLCSLLFAGCASRSSEDFTDRLKDKVDTMKRAEASDEDVPQADDGETPQDPTGDGLMDGPDTDPDGDDEVQNTEAEPAGLQELLMREADATPDEIAAFLQDDFDGNGEEEAFAIVGEQTDDEEMGGIEGTVWFVTKDGCVNLHGPAGMGLYAKPRTMVMGDKKYVLFDEIYATSLLTYVWTVSDGRAKETPFSALGELVIDPSDGEGRFRIMDSSYDCMYNPETDSWLGHTWKQYYFFYNDETGEVMEYAGTEIPEENVAFLCGKDLVEELVPRRDVVSSIFCRGNGLIVINYEHIADGCVMYYHYIYDFSEGHYVDDNGVETGMQPLDGICKEALCPKIASYPEVPGLNEQF